MKKFTLLLILTPFIVAAQYIATPTIVPALPTTNDSAYIIIKTMTPNLGHKLTRTATISKTGLVTIDICNYSGMPTAIQHYTDTFEVGQLSAGAWSLQVNYSISSNGGACTTQSVSENSFTVQNVTGIRNIHAADVSVYLNPATNVLFINADINGRFDLYDICGRRVLQSVKRTERLSVDLGHLPPGLYTLCNDTRRWKVMVER